MDNLYYKGYNGSVEYSKADNCLYGKVLGLNNSLILYEGNSLEELEKDFMGGIDHYLESCKLDCMQPEKPYNDELNIHIPVETYYRIAKYAEKRGTSRVSTVV